MWNDNLHLGLADSAPYDDVIITCYRHSKGQMWKVNLGLGHNLMDSKPTWTHDFLTTKGVKQTHTLPIPAFTAQTRGQ